MLQKQFVPIIAGIFLILLIIFVFEDYILEVVSSKCENHLVRTSRRREGADHNSFYSSIEINEKRLTKISSITNRDLYTIGNVNAPAVLLRVKGGTGNQLFQYACHYALARKNNLPLYIFAPESQTVSNRTFFSNQREFSLDQFSIPLFEWNMVTSKWNISNVHPVNDSQILSGQYSTDNVIQLSNSDYCQSELFFIPYKQEILEMFTLKIVPKADEVIDPKAESVAVHIRWGDFVRLNISVPLGFYKGAMKKLANKFGSSVKFYVFSDEILAVQKKLFSEEDKFPKSFEVHFITNHKTSLEEFYLMSKCKHQIIPNSSFGWWAAYLNRNPNKIVIAAHHDVNFFDRAYTSVGQQEFFKFQFRHIYYPINWIAVNPFSVVIFNKNI